MHVSLKALGLMLSCVLFAPASAGASDATPGKPKPEASIKREELRYDGKRFDEWRRILLTELKPKQRIEALTALQAFAAKGYAAEAAAAAIAVMEDWDPPPFARADHERTDRQGIEEIHPPDDESPEMYQAAALVLHKAGTAARPALLRTLKGRNKNQRLFALCWFTYPDASIRFALPTIENMVVDKDADIQEMALCALVTSIWDNEALEALSRTVKHGDAEIRRAAWRRYALFRASTFVDGFDERIIPLALAGLRDKEEEIRLEAVGALGRITNPVNPSPAELKAQAVKLLEPGQDGPKEVPGLVAVLKDPSPKVRRRAVGVLTPLIPLSKQIAQAMRDACKDSDPDVRKAALKALG